MKKVFFVIFVLSSFSIMAGNVWYEGKVTSIVTFQDDGSFMIYLDNQNIKDNCLYDRVIFKVSDMGVERTNKAFALALAAFTSGKTWGVVIDLPTSEAVCYASSTASQGALIR